MRSLAFVVCAGCSFVGVRGPSDRVGVLPDDPKELRCTESALLPSLDAVGGIIGVLAGGAGVLLEQASDDGEPENFTRYYAGPIALGTILYFISAGYGNNRITWCTEAHERIRAQRNAVTPIAPTQQRDDEQPGNL